MRANRQKWIDAPAGPVLAMIGAALIGAARTATATVLDFEDLPAGTTVVAQYGALGALFQQAYLDTDPAATSPTHVLRSVAPNAEIFTEVPLVIDFTSAQAHVKMAAESTAVAANGTLTAYDSNGAIVATDGPKLVAADVFTTSFEVTTETATIARVELRVENSAHEAIDDLIFEGEPPAPPPPAPPVVTITSPVDGANIDVNTLDIAGTVTGDGLLSTATLTVEYHRPPESSAPVFTSDLTLTGSGTTRQFSLPGGFTGVPLGPITVTVTTQNVVGDEGSASATVTNLPAAIRNRIQSDLAAGGPATGTFSFGIVGADCKIAVYAQEAVSADDAGATHVVRGDILTKWLTLRGANDNEGFGCPQGEERDGPGDSRVQDFADGRIYSDLSAGTHYVPSVFVDVIDTRDAELAGAPETTVPTADPVSPVEPAQTSTQTWLYQQFTRPDRLDLLPSTVEIRGTPPRIWIERQSGILASRTAALWEDYACSGNLGPCSVEAPEEDLEPIRDAGDLFCGGEAIADHRFDLVAGCVETALNACGRREWQHIKADDYVGTPLFGVVVESGLAGEDFFASHTWYYNCPLETVRPDCPSDWTLKVSPIGPQRGVEPFESILAEGNFGSESGDGEGEPEQTVEIEYERFYAEFAGWMGFPQAGDLIYAFGRWIIDCGHDSFRSELHPIYMYAKMKKVTELVDPFTGAVNSNPFGGQPATQADVWVNGWYPGGEPIEFDIFPPPRPSPTARLVVNKPVDTDAAFGISIEYSIQPAGAANHVHVKFTAPLRHNAVDVWGQVMWEINRGYEGQWYVYWAL